MRLFGFLLGWDWTLHRWKEIKPDVTVSMVKHSVGLSLHLIQHLETQTPEYKVLYSKVPNIRSCVCCFMAIKCNKIMKHKNKFKKKSVFCTFILIYLVWLCRNIKLPKIQYVSDCHAVRHPTDFRRVYTKQIQSSVNLLIFTQFNLVPWCYFSFAITQSLKRCFHHNCILYCLLFATWPSTALISGLTKIKVWVGVIRVNTDRNYKCLSWEFQKGVNGTGSWGSSNKNLESHQVYSHHNKHRYPPLAFISSGLPSLTKTVALPRAALVSFPRCPLVADVLSGGECVTSQ